jgi:hypothetical protein
MGLRKGSSDALGNAVRGSSNSITLKLGFGLSLKVPLDMKNNEDQLIFSVTNIF